MPALRSSISIAAACGLVAAIPIVLIVLAAPGWVDSSMGRAVAMPAAAICPPWWLFWSVLGLPESLGFALKLSALVLLLNAVLFAPVGWLYAATRNLRPAIRRALFGAGSAFTLALGHAVFVSEPAPLAALIGRLA